MYINSCLSQQRVPAYHCHHNGFCLNYYHNHNDLSKPQRALCLIITAVTMAIHLIGIAIATGIYLIGTAITIAIMTIKMVK